MLNINILNDVSLESDLVIKTGCFLATGSSLYSIGGTSTQPEGGFYHCNSGYPLTSGRGDIIALGAVHFKKKTESSIEWYKKKTSGPLHHFNFNNLFHNYTTN